MISPEEAPLVLKFSLNSPDLDVNSYSHFKAFGPFSMNSTSWMSSKFPMKRMFRFLSEISSYYNPQLKKLAAQLMSHISWWLSSQILKGVREANKNGSFRYDRWALLDINWRYSKEREQHKILCSLSPASSLRSTSTYAYTTPPEWFICFSVTHLWFYTYYRCIFHEIFTV